VSAPLNSANPMRTDGFEFVEYAAPDPELLRRLFESMGLPAVARHRSKNVTLHNQGDINFIINAERDSFAQKFARTHGPCACAMAFRVADSRAAFKRALGLGATPGPATAGPMELNIPSIEGIGGSLIATATARFTTWTSCRWLRQPRALRGRWASRASII
jgi:4-hydroxyphenylpyruvate dioxygenase